MLFLLLTGCADAPPRPPTDPVASHDGAVLNRLYHPPADLGSVVWADAALGVVGLGPTDVRLVMWFPEVSEGRRTQLLTTRTAEPLPTDPLALTVLPPGAYAEGSYHTTAFETTQWHGDTAWVVGGGVYVELQTR